MSALRAEEVEEDGKREGGGVPCSGLRRELLDCLRESDCVKIVSVPRLISLANCWCDEGEPFLFS